MNLRFKDQGFRVSRDMGIYRRHGLWGLWYGVPLLLTRGSPLIRLCSTGLGFRGLGFRVWGLRFRGNPGWGVHQVVCGEGILITKWF